MTARHDPETYVAHGFQLVFAFLDDILAAWDISRVQLELGDLESEVQQRLV